MHGQSSRGRLRALGLHPQKRLSQAFLEDEQVAQAIVAAADLDGAQDVLEVGPGLGVLTGLLARAARRVVAVEIDPALAAGLRIDLEGTNVSVLTEDVLKIDPSRFFDAPFVVIGNLPYHITSPALRHLLRSGPPFASRLVVMLQAEVAERIAAAPGDMSALAVALQAQSRVRLVRRVPAACFYPQPKVDSAVLVLDPLADAERQIARDELPHFVELVQAGFRQPRKQLANSLSEGLGITRQAAVERLRAVHVEPSLRPQVLSVADWVRLFRST